MKKKVKEKEIMFNKDRLKEARIKKGLSQHELAKLAVISQPAICQFESGKKRPNAEMLEILADILGVSMDYLHGRE